MENDHITHKQMQQRLSGLVGRNIVNHLCYCYFPYTRKMPDIALAFRVFPEVTVRERNNGQTNRFGGAKPDSYRIDAVLAVKPGRDALNQESVFTVGIELKGSIDDLRADKKFTHYRGWCSLMFFAVPNDLILAAEEKVEFFEDIGVIDIDSGYIRKYPRMYIPLLEKQIELLKQLVFNNID